MSNFKIQPATRQSFKPLIGLYAESGAGKTYSALLLARGLVGPAGTITMIDTEGGRGSLYSDVIQGGYQVLDMEPPFHPKRLIEAIEAVETSKTDVLIIDSASHFWEGIGGVLEWAGELEAQGKKGRQIWKDPKMAHERMVGKILQTRLPVIVCLRAKHLLVETIDPVTKRKEMSKDPNATPKQAEDFIFNLTFHAEIKQDHTLRITKVSHPGIRACFPENGCPITVATGEQLARWCKGASTPAPKTLDRTKLLTELRDVTSARHGWKKGMPATAWPPAKAKLQDWLDTVGITPAIDKMTAEQLSEAITQIKAIR